MRFCLSWRFRQLLLWYLPVLTAQVAGAQTNATSLALPELSAWDYSGSVRVAGGYKDNVELSASRPIDSGLINTQADFLLWRLPDERFEVLVYGTGNFTKFFTDEATTDNESIAYAEMEGRWTPAANWRLSSRASVFYFNQFMDISVNDVMRTVVKLQSTGGTMDLGVRRQFANGTWIEAQPTLRRDTYRDGLDNAWQREGRLAVGSKRGEHWEWSSALKLGRRDYDRREQVNFVGLAESDTRLRFTRHEVESRITWQSGATRAHRLSLGLDALRSRENGSGYFDYDYVAIGPEWEWKRSPWSGRVLTRVGRYRYPHRFGDSEFVMKEKQDYLVEARVSRALGKGLSAFAEYAWERSRVEVRTISYRVSTVMFGITWEP